VTKIYPLLVVKSTKLWSCWRFRKFRSEFKWKGPFRFLPTGMFGITSGGGPLISVGIFWPIPVPFLTNQFFALIRESGQGIKNDKSHSHWLVWFNWKTSFHFCQVFPLISDQLVWHNGRHPLSNMTTIEFRFFMAYTLELNFSHIIKKLPNTCRVTVAVFVVTRWFVVRLHGWESRKQKLLLRLYLFTQLFLKPKNKICWCEFGFIYVLMDINTL